MIRDFIRHLLNKLFLWLYGSREEEVERVVEEQGKRINDRRRARVRARVSASLTVEGKPTAEKFAEYMDPERRSQKRKEQTEEGEHGQ